MILYKRTESGRTFINESSVIKKLYRHLKQEYSQCRIINIQIIENDVLITLSNNATLLDTEIVEFQKYVKEYLRKKFNFFVDEVELTII